MDIIAESDLGSNENENPYESAILQSIEREAVDFRAYVVIEISRMIFLSNDQ